MILKTRQFEIALRPERGGLVERVVHLAPDGARRDWLLPPEGRPDDAAATPKFGVWPMVPFANRAFDGVVRADGQCWQLPINDPARNATIHGFGWQDRWDVPAFGAGQAVMTHQHRSPGRGYAYDARFAIAAQEDGLLFELSVVNRAGEAMPFGLGLHPWFPRRADTRVMLLAQGALDLPDDLRNGVPGPVPAPFDFRSARGLGEATLAASYLDWSGVAEIVTPSLGLALRMSAGESLRHPLLWAPTGADFFCLEPQSHALGAPSEPSVAARTPLALLQPGEALSGWMRLEPLERRDA